MVIFQIALLNNKPVDAGNEFIGIIGSGNRCMAAEEGSIEMDGGVSGKNRKAEESKWTAKLVERKQQELRLR